VGKDDIGNLHVHHASHLAEQKGRSRTDQLSTCMKTYAQESKSLITKLIWPPRSAELNFAQPKVLVPRHLLIVTAISRIFPTFTYIEFLNTISTPEMADAEPDVPETHVLAIASHVRVLTGPRKSDPQG
jgi:hypothetical protein